MILLMSTHAAAYQIRWHRSDAGSTATRPPCDKDPRITAPPLASNRRAWILGGAAFYSATAAVAVDGNGFEESTSGLKYKITQQGSGPTPQRGQKVFVDYTLWLDGFNGKQIDSSRGFPMRPFSFNAGTGGVIKGWDEAVMSMKVGEARKLIVPSSLGYGTRGAGRVIPPDSKLYFDMEIKSMGSPKAMSPEQLKWLEEHPM